MIENTLPYIEDFVPEITVTYSYTVPFNERIQIQASQDAVAIFRELWHDKTMEYKERFYVLCLSRSNHVLGYFLHSVGGLSGTVVDIKQILGVAVKANAASIILAHNHPSGNTNPSSNDRTLTNKIVKGASLLDLSVLDHLILTEDGYYSFADEGTLSAKEIFD